MTLPFFVFSNWGKSTDFTFYPLIKRRITACCTKFITFAEIDRSVAKNKDEACWTLLKQSWHFQIEQLVHTKSAVAQLQGLLRRMEGRGSEEDASFMPNLLFRVKVTAACSLSWLKPSCAGGWMRMDEGETLGNLLCSTSYKNNDYSCVCVCSKFLI